MAQYDASLYGSSVYGPDSSPLFLVGGFTAKPVGFGGVELAWTNPGATTWVRMRLVRSQYGFPANQNDGVVLFDINDGPAAVAPLDESLTSYLDPNLQTPKFYYYSLFISRIIGNSIIWTRSGNVIAQAVDDHQYDRLLLNRLPGIYSSISGAAAELAGGQSTPLSRFLSIFGYDLDRVRDYLDHLNGAVDPEWIHANLLQEILNTFAYAFEPMVGIRNNRAYAREAAFLSQMKGTTPALVTLGQAVTGYQVKQLPFVNLLLDENDASFEQSIGHWQVVTGSVTLARSTSFSRSDGVNGAVGSLQVTATAGGNCDLSPMNSGYGFGSGLYGAGQYGSGTALRAIQYGIPVVPNLAYTFSAYFLSPGATIQPLLDINWFDKTGVYLSTTAGVAGATTNGTFTTRISTSDIAPPGAVLADPHIRLVGMSNTDVHYIDQAQFEQAASASTYSPARQIRLRLIAPRINEVLNPGFDLDVTNWTTSNATAAWEGTITYNGGAGSAKVTPSGAGNAGIWAAVTVDPDVPFVGAFQVYSTTQQTFNIVMQWYDKSGSLIRTDNPGSILVPATTWTRLGVVGLVVPANAATGRINATVVPATGGTGAVFYVDDVLVEEINLWQGVIYGDGGYGAGGYGGVTGQPNLIGNTPYGAGLYGGGLFGGVNPPAYFDFRTDPVDAKWEGTASASRLHLYPVYGIRQARYSDLVSKAIPLGATYSILAAVGRPS